MKRLLFHPLFWSIAEAVLMLVFWAGLIIAAMVGIKRGSVATEPKKAPAVASPAETVAKSDLLAQ